MKYKGQAIEKPQPKIIPLIREPEVVQDEDGKSKTIDKNIYIRADVVLDFKEFEELCEEPEAPVIKEEGKAPRTNLNDPNYRLALEDYGLKRMNWLFLKSVEDTPDLEWEKVKMNDPSTWENFPIELREAGFTQPQINMLLNEVYTLQIVDEKKVEEARRSFLASHARVTGK